MAEQTIIKRVESFPFTSSDDGYDADGYPVYDRAVGSDVLRATFREFFSDGVFPSPAGALQISKGEGLSVDIATGAYIINGAMGWTGDGGMSITLDTAAPQGNVAYAIMLRYDENINSVGGVDVGRSLSIRAVKGEASSSPQPPEPESGAGIVEYRLGYVTVPSGAVDLTGATVTNEKGLAICPYAAPFEEIDLSQVVTDAQNQAQEATDAFLAYAKTYYDLVASALDGTTAGELQSQIDAITPAGLVDDATLGQSSAGKMQVKDGGISTAKLADGCVTHDKLEAGMQASVPATLGAAGTILKSDGTSAKWAEQSLDLVTLWEGNWTKGEITVPGISDYEALRVTIFSGGADLSGQGILYQNISLIAVRSANGASFSGACGYRHTDSNYYNQPGVAQFSVTIDGDTIVGISSITGENLTEDMNAAWGVYQRYDNKLSFTHLSVKKIEGWLK